MKSTFFVRFLKPPVFRDDEHKTLRARVLNILILTTIGFIPFLALVNWLGGNPMPQVGRAGVVITVIMLGLSWLLRRGWVTEASVIWMFSFLVFASIGLFEIDLARHINLSLYFFAIVVAGLLFGQRGIFSVAVCGSLLVLGIILAGNFGVTRPLISGVPGWVVWLSYTGLFTAVALIVLLTISLLNRAVQRVSLELAERNKTETSLRQRDEIFQAVNFFVQDFFKSTDWRKHIQDVLARLGKATRASHVYIFERHHLPDGQPALSQRYEWVAEDGDSDLGNPDFQNISLSEMDAWYEQLERGEICQGNLHDFQAPELQPLARAGLKAIVEAPIMIGSKWWGVIGFDDYRQARQWSGIEIESIKTAASTLGAAIQRQANDTAKLQRDAIMQAVTFAAQRFLRSNNWQDQILAVLEKLGTATDSSHVYLFRNHRLADGRPGTSQMYEWAAPGVPPDLDNPLYQDMPIEDPDTHQWLVTMRAGEAFYGNVDTLTPEARKIYISRGLLTFIDVPILVRGQWWGIMGFDDFAHVRDWSELEIEAIKIASSILGMAIERQMNDDALRESELRNRSELEARVQQRTAQLEEALREIENVSYTVSHDLRAPLRAVNGYSNILVREQGDKIDATSSDYLKRIASEAQRMGEMLDDLLELIRLNRVPMRRTNANLSEMFSSTVQEICAHQVIDRKPECVTQPNLFATCDVSMLQSAFGELVGNACKFMAGQSNPRIEFGAREADGELQFFVRDNGVGFDMAYVHRMFRNFEQLAGPGKVEGTGMGLAKVQRIIYRHGGRIWIEGKPNEGATVYFTFGE